jgi:hypothetical protein
MYSRLTPLLMVALTKTWPSRRKTNGKHVPATLRHLLCDSLRKRIRNIFLEKPVPTNRRQSPLVANNFNHLTRLPLSKMSNMG